MGTARHRIEQGLRALRPEMPHGADAIIERLLTERQRERFRQLPVFDQAHLVRAVSYLIERGEADRDLLVATLLHDIGKTNEHGSVRLIHRVGRVLLRQIWPRFLDRASRPPAVGWRNGFVLASHHPELGAAIAEKLGCSERAVWLIRNHENRDAAGDPDIAKLMDADRHG
jgi:putative nucleotidyltransferase with HDIG domain